MNMSNFKNKTVPKHYYEHESLVATVVINPEDIQAIHYYICEEVKYYNSLIEFFNAFIKREPNFFNDIKQSWEEIFLSCAKIKYNVSILRNAKEDHELPMELEKYRRILLQKDDNKQRYLNEKMIIFLEQASKAGNILPAIRYNIAYELLKFFKEQAKIAGDSKVRNSNDNVFTYKKNFTTLELVDTSRKYHVQIPKRYVTCNYDEDNKVLNISTPYTKHPIRIENLKYFNNKKWDVLIISKTPSFSARDKKDWNITFKNTKYKYLLKLLENTNPYLSSNLFKQGMPKVY